MKINNFRMRMVAILAKSFGQHFLPVVGKRHQSSSVTMLASFALVCVCIAGLLGQRTHTQTLSSLLSGQREAGCVRWCVVAWVGAWCGRSGQEVLCWSGGWDWDGVG